ncbi:MAG TPA: 7-cyano-7-deazaguanine synthase [Tepidanaerobacteraceae bacterium]|nr:7-cyano-7-deazaguanine synthase [Tepidanaerobacteraceae bacterium]
MSIVTLVSGGLDSTVMALLVHEEGIIQYPLFIDYGQINLEKELNACLNNFKRLGLPPPQISRIGGYGNLLSSGLTDSNKRVFEDAFLPCRNLLFLTVGSAYAYQCGANSVAIGLLDEKYCLFPDQTVGFIKDAEALISKSLDYKINILTPLISFSKAEVCRIAINKGVNQTYSCHTGSDKPCGLCISCREYDN